MANGDDDNKDDTPQPRATLPGAGGKNPNANPIKNNNPNGGGGGGGGYGGYGGGGGGGGNGTTVVKPDPIQQQNAVADAGNNIVAYQNNIDNANRTLGNTKKANKKIWTLDTLENQRSTDVNWFIQQQKLQNAYQNQRRSSGTGLNGQGLHQLNNLYARSDDISDQQLLNNQQKTQNQINEELYKNQVEAVNSYNNALADVLNGVYDTVGSFATTYGNLTGSKTKNKNSGSTTTQTVTTNKNPYVTYGKNGQAKLNYKKLNKMFGLKLDGRGGDASIGRFLQIPELKQQNNYRTPKTVRTHLGYLTNSQKTGSAYLNSLRYGE